MSATSPTVSVVMPVRNAERTLRPALQSIMAQTLADWELVVVDDGSEDGTASVLDEFARNRPQLRVLPAAGRGIVAALNQGVEAARADLIARMDADDISHPDRLRAQVELMKARPDIGLVSCLVEFGGDRVRSEGYALHVDWLNQVIDAEAILLNRFIESPLAHPSVMFRRFLVRLRGGYREGPFPEDYELWLRWLHAGVRMTKVPRTLLTWSDRVNRLSRTDPRYDREAFFEVKARYLAATIRATSKGRPVWIWGAGRPTRRRADLLCGHGLNIAGYVDIDPGKAGRSLQGRLVITPGELPTPDDTMVIGYVSNRGARDLIRDSLLTRGYVEGADFWMAA